MTTDPGQALERIASLLERAAQPSRRVEAFRTAAADVLAGGVPEYLSRWEATAQTPLATGGEALHPRPARGLPHPLRRLRRGRPGRGDGRDGP